MTKLQATLNALASDFATSVLQALRNASIEEVLDAAQMRATRARGLIPPARVAKRSGRLGRRSADDIAALVERIVALLEAHPDGLRAEEIRRGLGLESKELPRPLADALTAKRIRKEGQKRATTYFARAGAPRGRKPRKSARKPAITGHGKAASAASANGAALAG